MTVLLLIAAVVAGQTPNPPLEQAPPPEQQAAPPQAPDQTAVPEQTPPPDQASIPEQPTIPEETPPLRKDGFFHLGTSLEIPVLGLAQAVGGGGMNWGGSLGIGFQQMLTPRFGLRFQLHLDIVLPEAFIGFAISAAAVYRWFHGPTQRWIPFVGLGIEAGAFIFGREVLGLQILQSPDFIKAGFMPEALGGLELRIWRGVGIAFTLYVDYANLSGYNLFVLRESSALHVTF